MPRRAPIGLLGLLAILFLTVSGGPYGLEPLVGSLGGAASLTLLAVVPLIWSLPIAAMAAELSAALPALGGYYQWVREAMGEFWGFQEGWWSWMFTWVDMPLYPALCGEILRESWPLLTGRTLSNLHALLFVLGFIAAGVAVNLTGARVVADYSMITTLAVMVPFVFFIAAIWREPAASAVVAAPMGGLGLSGWAVGLSTVMWNYAGWDNISTFAPAVREPARTYPRALLAGVALIALCYLGPVMAGLRLDPVAAHWQNGYFVQLGARALGRRAAMLMALTAVASAWAQFTAQLLYVMPLPVSLARDGYLPKVLGRVNRRGVAVPALGLCALIYCLFALAAFSSLVVADVLLYSTALSLEFLALLRLRRREADNAETAATARFRIPLSGGGLRAFCALPIGLAAATLAFAFYQQRLFTLVAVGMLASGPVWYGLAKWQRLRLAAGLEA